MRHLDTGSGGAGTSRLLLSALTVLLLTLAQSTAAAPPPGKGGGKPGSGGGGDGGESCSYPAFADVPRQRLERRERKRRYDDFSSAPRYGWVREAISDTASITLIGDGQLHGTAWAHEEMVDPLNRSGNADIDEVGKLCSGCTPVGKRHSAWYGDSSSLVASVVDANGDGVADDAALSMRGALYAQSDPTRPGTDPWSTIRPQTSWLKTWERGQDSQGRWFVEGNLSTAGTHKFKAPLYLEASVNFSRMRTPGYRLSLWLMPATFEVEDGQPAPFAPAMPAPGECDFSDPMNPPPPLLTNGCYSSNSGSGFRSEAYDRNWENGYEMDLFEFEPAGVIEIADENGATEEIVCGNAIEFSALNDYVGERGKDTEYAVKNHFEGFEEGYCDPMAVYGELSCDKTYANPAQDTNYLINDDVWHKIGFLWTTEELIWIFNDEIVLEIIDPERIPHPSVHQYLNLSREITNGLTAGTIVPSTDGSMTYDTYLPAEAGLYGWDGRSNAGDFLGNIADDEALIRYIKVWNLTEPQQP